MLIKNFVTTFTWGHMIAFSFERTLNYVLHHQNNNFDMTRTFA